MQEALREGDTLVVRKLDRSGQRRASRDLIGKMHKRGVQFKGLTNAIHIGSGRFFSYVIAGLNAMERELTTERVSKPTSGWPANSAALAEQTADDRQQDQISRKLLASGVPPRDVASNLYVPVPTLYR